MRLTDAVFARMIVDIRSLQDAMPSELKADIDGDFLTAIAEQPIKILKCAMYLFLGYLDGTSQFAQACGGGGISSDLPWGRNQDEDDCRFAYRCMMQTHKMLKPFQPKRRIDDMNFMCFTMSQNWAYLYKITEGKITRKWAGQLHLPKQKKATLAIKITYSGGDLEIRVDDIQAIHAKYAPIESNGFGFFAFGNTKVDFDNIEIVF